MRTLHRQTPLGIVVLFFLNSVPAFAEHSFIEVCKKGFARDNPGFALVTYATSMATNFGQRIDNCRDALSELEKESVGSLILYKAPHITHLDAIWDLDFLQVLDVGPQVVSLRGVGRMKGLQLLEINHRVPLEEEIEEISSLSQLSSLVLFNSEAPRLPLPELSALGKMSQMEKLAVSNWTVQDLNFLSKLKRLTRLVLKDLDLIVWPGFDLPKLAELDLSGNNIKSTDGLEKLQQLKSLYLNGNPLERTQVENLRRQLPNTHIFF